MNAFQVEIEEAKNMMSENSCSTRSWFSLLLVVMFYKYEYKCRLLRASVDRSGPTLHP